MVTRRLAAALVVCSLCAVPLAAQIRFADDADRDVFRQWFVFLADAQFYRATPDVMDCAGLIRHALREAVKPHTPDWYRRAAWPVTPGLRDVRVRITPTADGWPLFRVGPNQFAEFADARTIIRLNARTLGRDVRALQPGDLLFFTQDGQAHPDHVMVFIGPSRFERDDRDWIVYHTGPDTTSPGEVRKTRLADLLQHPAPRWRPVVSNPAFVGVFRLAWL